MELLAVEVAAPDGKTQDGVSSIVPQAVQVFAPLPLAAFYAIVNHFMRVKAQALGMLRGALHIARIVPVIQENRVGYTAVCLVPDPVAVG